MNANDIFSPNCSRRPSPRDAPVAQQVGPVARNWPAVGPHVAMSLRASPRCCKLQDRTMQERAVMNGKVTACNTVVLFFTVIHFAIFAINSYTV